MISRRITVVFATLLFGSAGAVAGENTEIVRDLAGRV